MSIYRDTARTKTSNIFLKQCGQDLVKVASENSKLITESEKLREKISSMEKEVEAYRTAATLIERGRLAPSEIKIKVATILRKPVEITEQSASRSTFSKVSSVGGQARAALDRDREDAQRISKVINSLNS